MEFIAVIAEFCIFTALVTVPPPNMSLRVNLEDQTPQKPMETLSRQRLLRKIAVTSTTLGFILNLVAILTVRHGGKPWRSAKTLTGWAFLPVSRLNRRTTTTV